MPAGAAKKSKGSYRLPAGFSAFSLCFLIAASIWLINELDKEHRYSTELEIAYRNDQLSSSPYTLKLDLKGRGFDFINVWSDLHKVWYVDENELGSSNAVATLNLAKQYLATKSSAIDVLASHPSYLPPPNSQYPYQKRLKVIPNYRIATSAGFMQDGPAVVYPDSVTLFSNSPLPDSVVTIHTASYQRSKVNQSVFGSVELEKFKGIDYQTSRTQFWIYVPVGAGTSYRIRLALQRGEGLPVNSILLPSSVEINALVPVRSLNRIHPGSFQVRADIMHPEQKKALVKMIKTPPRCQILQVQPSTVDYYFNR